MFFIFYLCALKLLYVKGSMKCCREIKRKYISMDSPLVSQTNLGYRLTLMIDFFRVLRTAARKNTARFWIQSLDSNIALKDSNNCFEIFFLNFGDGEISILKIVCKMSDFKK